MFVAKHTSITHYKLYTYVYVYTYSQSHLFKEILPADTNTNNTMNIRWTKLSLQAHI